MNRARGLRVGVALVIVALTFLVAWRVAGDDDTQRSGPTPTSTTVSTTTTIDRQSTTVPLEEPQDSLAAVLPTSLAGYRVDIGAKATGVLDLDAAVAAESDTQAERALLETRRFEGGYGRAFTNDETDVYMVVYDFVGVQDASLYLADGFITLQGRGAGIYDVPEVPGARGFSQSTESDGRPAVVHGVAFAKGDRFVLVFTRAATTSTPTQAKELVSTLYARA